jgi:hypothetical protein
MSDHDHSGAMAEIDNKEDQATLSSLLSKIDDYADKKGKRGLGHFLSACLSGDLMTAVGHADTSSMRVLRPVVNYIYNHHPAMFASPLPGLFRKINGRIQLGHLGPVEPEMRRALGGIDIDALVAMQRAAEDRGTGDINWEKVAKLWTESL